MNNCRIVPQKGGKAKEMLERFIRDFGGLYSLCLKKIIV
jgi:hypothetical protein